MIDITSTILTFMGVLLTPIFLALAVDTVWRG